LIEDTSRKLTANQYQYFGAIGRKLDSPMKNQAMIVFMGIRAKGIESTRSLYR
jgi:hypothetical protein